MMSSLTKSRGNQNGFSIAIIFAAILVFCFVALAGFYVYNKNKTQPTSAAPNGQQQNNAQQSKTPITEQNIIKIPELGIQITVPDSIKDLTYQTHSATLRNGNQATAAFFSTSSLATADANCGPDAAPLGSLSKADGQYPTEKEDETNVLDYGQLLKQFPTFYITVGYPQAVCSKEAAIQASASTYKNAFVSAQVSVEPLN